MEGFQVWSREDMTLSINEGQSLEPRWQKVLNVSPHKSSSGSGSVKSILSNNPLIRDVEWFFQMQTF